MSVVVEKLGHEWRQSLYFVLSSDAKAYFPSFRWLRDGAFNRWSGGNANRLRHASGYEGLDRLGDRLAQHNPLGSSLYILEQRSQGIEARNRLQGAGAVHNQDLDSLQRETRSIHRRFHVARSREEHIASFGQEPGSTQRADRMTRGSCDASQ